jgi:hypothetical protein
VTGEGASGGDASGGGVTGDEAAWRDLVARYEMPADWDAASVPWPDRENLTDRPFGAVQESPGNQDGPKGQDVAEKDVADNQNVAADGDVPDRDGAADQDGAEQADGRNGHSFPGPPPRSGADRTRVIRPATPPRGPDPVPASDRVRDQGADPGQGAEDDEEHFIPPTPPPLPHLDPVAKGAWTALFGGPAYLVLASLVGWTVPGWAALVAVMAFVGGFAIVVLRLGDGPSRGDDDDNGAVI